MWWRMFGCLSVLFVLCVPPALARGAESSSVAGVRPGAGEAGLRRAVCAKIPFAMITYLLTTLRALQLPGSNHGRLRRLLIDGPSADRADDAPDVGGKPLARFLACPLELAVDLIEAAAAERVARLAFVRRFLGRRLGRAYDRLADASLHPPDALCSAERGSASSGRAQGELRESSGRAQGGLRRDWASSGRDWGDQGRSGETEGESARLHRRGRLRSAAARPRARSASGPSGRRGGRRGAWRTGCRGGGLRPAKGVEGVEGRGRA